MLASAAMEPTVRLWSPTAPEPQPLPDLEALLAEDDQRQQRHSVLHMLLNGMGALADLMGVGGMFRWVVGLIAWCMAEGARDTGRGKQLQVCV